MTATLHLVTAVARHLADHFDATAASVREARERVAAAGHRLAWSVCVDGDGDGDLPGLDQADTLVHLRTRLGVSVARNVASLSAPAGSWLLPVDGDDICEPDGMAELAESLDRVDDAVAWVATNRLALDGTATRSWSATTRAYEAGELNREYRHPYRFHPNNVAARVEAVLAAGGWPATPGGEDLALVLRLAGTHPGLSLTTVTVRYRRWEHQTTAAGSAFEQLRPHRHQLLERFDLVGGRSGAALREPRHLGTPGR